MTRRWLTRAALTIAASVGLLGCSAAMAPTAGHDEPLLALTDVAAQRVQLADTDVAAQRVQLADTVAAAKWGTDAPITDPTREQAVLDAVATKLSIDPVLARAVFTDQIEANKAVQYGLYAHWRTHPDQAPTTRPELSQVRPILDHLTDQLLTGLTATQQLRADPSCAGRLAGARHRIEHTRHLDPLHDDALTRALISICRQPG
ncbi:MAG: chorismate mutase [Pseudonocardiaceae bacterium]